MFIIDVIEIGKRIKEQRKELNMTLEQLADALGFNKSTLQRYEAGKISKIKLPVLQSISRVLKVDPNWLALKTDVKSEYVTSDMNNTKFYSPQITDDVTVGVRMTLPITELKYRLKEALAYNNMRPIDLSQKTNIPKSSISQYCSGYAKPNSERVYLISKALNVSEAWLMGYDAPRERMDTSINQFDNIIPIKTKKVPLLGDIACGEPILCNQEYELYIDVAEDIQADFCVRAKGDSMINARIFNGDIVFCRQQPTVEDGEIAVVIVNDEATLKRVYQYKNRIELRAENPTFKAMEFEGEALREVRILGKAIAFQSMIM